MLLACVWSLLVIAVIIALFYFLYNKTGGNEKFVPIGYTPAKVTDEQLHQIASKDQGLKGASEGITQIEPYDSVQTYGSIEAK